MKRFCAFIMIIVMLFAVACSSGDVTEEGTEYGTPQENANEAPILGEDKSSHVESYAPITGDWEAEDGGNYFGDYEEPIPNNSGESYLPIQENGEKAVSDAQTLTFSLKVDTASYTNVQRYVQNGEQPPADAVRIEEMINYFNYEGQMSFNGHPFSIYTELGPSPFDEGKHMAFVRVKAEEIDKSDLPRCNLTFLIDTSGSMTSYDKLPLLKESFELLVETLDEDDVVSIVTYAGNAGVLLDSVSGADKERIMSAINSLESGGSTAGSAGIETAYALAKKNFREDGNNRVILASDGDFNVGISSLEGLNDLVNRQRESGIYLSVLGFGTGNIRDDVMETLAKNGNGNYSYINTLSTANKVLVEELASNLYTIAEDVKAQVEFNPANVKSYRLIGYENRMLENKDFTDDTKDAGEIGVGTDVVVMFELELQDGADTQKYGEASTATPTEYGDELFEVRLRYKNPGEQNSIEMKQPAVYEKDTANTSDYRFACSVAAFGHILRNSEHMGVVTMKEVTAVAGESLGRDEGGYRKEFVNMLKQYNGGTRW